MIFILLILFIIIEILQCKDTPEGRKKIFSYYRKLYGTIHSVHNGESILCPFVDGVAGMLF